MRKIFLITAAVLLVLCFTIGTGFAEDFNPDEYSYEELLIIQEKVTTRIEAIDRANAIANANRAVNFEESEKTVYLRQTTQQVPAVTILADGAPGQTAFVWTSSDPEIAAVNGNGTVTGIARGEATITATAQDDQYVFGSYTVHVLIPVETITVWGPDTPLQLGNDQETAAALLGYSIEPEDADCQSIIWSSSDEEIATVDENGMVHGLKAGEVTITATSAENPPSAEGTVTAEYRITIVQLVTAVGFAQGEMTMNVGETAAAEVAIAPEEAGNKTLTYTSSNPEVVTAGEDGTLTAVGCGVCEITCETTDGSGITASCRVTVTQPVTGITLSDEEVRLTIGGTYAVEAAVEPEDASNKNVIWTSSNPFVARVAAGRIEAVGQGNCVVTCTTTDGSNLTATVAVRVPTFSTEMQEYTVTEKKGLRIPILLGKSDTQIEAASEAECFTVTLEGNELVVLPLTAGTGSVTLNNPEAPEDVLEIQIVIEDSAVFNEISYPRIPYEELLTAPDAHEGEQMSAYGKILQIYEAEEEKQTFVIGTGNMEFTDETFLIICEKGMLPVYVKEGDMVTVYGIFRMEHIYSEALQAETLLPAIEAERMVVPEPEETAD